jgi:hypothetical protein
MRFFCFTRLPDEQERDSKIPEIYGDEEAGDSNGITRGSATGASFSSGWRMYRPFFGVDIKTTSN